MGNTRKNNSQVVHRVFKTPEILLATLFSSERKQALAADLLQLEHEILDWWHHQYVAEKDQIQARIRTALRRMEKKGLITCQRSKAGEILYSLTALGARCAAYPCAIIERRIGKSLRWDKRWRILIFDMPERIKRQRDFLREQLRLFGFRMLQKSVWASPYPIPRELHDLLWQMRLKYHILYLLVTAIDYDQPLRQLFPEMFTKKRRKKKVKYNAPSSKVVV